MAELQPSNGRKSVRCPLVGTNDGELEFSPEKRVPVRIENESAGGFGIYCNADVSLWENEVLMLYRGADVYEVRVAHVSEVEVPRRSEEPEPEWLPLRIGLERLRLVAENSGPIDRKHWLKRLFGYADRPTNRPMVVVGLLLAAIFVAAPYVSVFSGRAGDRPFFVSLRASSGSLMDSVISWFGKPDSARGSQTESAAPFPRWRGTTEQLQQQVDAVYDRLETAAVPVQLKANAVIDDAQQWLNATAKNTAENSAVLQEHLARETERWMETGSGLFDAVLEQVESGNAFEEWEAAFGAAGTTSGAPASPTSTPATPAQPPPATTSAAKKTAP
jgi:hypothetical protein